MFIRKATEEDAIKIAKVYVDSWRTTYQGIVSHSYLKRLSYEASEKTWLQGIQAHGIFIAENDVGDVVGFALGGRERTGKYETYDGELYAIYLLEEAQGKGIGRKLLYAVALDLKEKGFNSMLIWALAKNSACAFYEKMGGKRIDVAEIEIDDEQLEEIAFGWEQFPLKENES